MTHLGSTAMQPPDFVSALYRHLLGREPDSGGLRYWTELIETCGDHTLVLQGFLHSEEYRSRKGTVSTEREQRVLEAIAPALKRPLLIVDVGAQSLDTEQHVYQPLIESGLPYHITGFEPLEAGRATRLAAEASAHLTLLGDFVGDGGTHRFYINNFDATSSLLPLNMEGNARFIGLSDLATVRIQEVATSTLDELMGDVQVDFLKLDIQGFEFAVLQNCPKLLQRTMVVHCEVEFYPIYRDQPLFSETELFLRRSGFDLIDLKIRHHYSLQAPSQSSSDCLLWADAVFMKNAYGDREEGADRLSQAVIAFLVYKKYSLSEWLAQAHDRVHGTGIAQAFG